MLRRNLLLITLTAVCAVFAWPYSARAAGILDVRFTDDSGKPLPKASIKELCCRDLSDDPFVTSVKTYDGRAKITLPDAPCQLSALLSVPGFGEVVIYADNSGKGYTKPSTISFPNDAVHTRRLRVAAAIKKARSEGAAVPASVEQDLKLAVTGAGYSALAAALRAGEQVTMLRAHHAISKLQQPRKGFLLGCNLFGYPARGPVYEQRFKELFNYGTTNLYLSRFAPARDVRDFTRTDNEVAWLRAAGMAAKPCPPIYFAKSVTPDWIKALPFEEQKKASYDLVYESCSRYKGKVIACEITNELHDMSNALALTQPQISQITMTAALAARKADPNVLRIINCAHLWGDYAARTGKDQLKRRTPYQYLRQCTKEGVPFEVVGLQMYYPEYDLLEIDRMLDRFSKLGKPIHITEMGCASAPGIDPSAQRKKAAAGWHGDWTEQMQAEWVESVYTIFYSKPYIKAVSWWDLADAVSFWPYGGLLRGDLSPKPAYTRLMDLKKQWHIN